MYLECSCVQNIQNNAEKTKRKIQINNNKMATGNNNIQEQSVDKTINALRRTIASKFEYMQKAHGICVQMFGDCRRRIVYRAREPTKKRTQLKIHFSDRELLSLRAIAAIHPVSFFCIFKMQKNYRLISSLLHLACALCTYRLVCSVWQTFALRIESKVSRTQMRTMWIVCRKAPHSGCHRHRIECSHIFARSHSLTWRTRPTIITLIWREEKELAIKNQCKVKWDRKMKTKERCLFGFAAHSNSNSNEKCENVSFHSGEYMANRNRAMCRAARQHIFPLVFAFSPLTHLVHSLYARLTLNWELRADVHCACACGLASYHVHAGRAHLFIFLQLLL